MWWAQAGELSPLAVVKPPANRQLRQDIEKMAAVTYPPPMPRHTPPAIPLEGRCVSAVCDAAWRGRGRFRSDCEEEAALEPAFRFHVRRRRWCAIPTPLPAKASLGLGLTAAVVVVRRGVLHLRDGRANAPDGTGCTRRCLKLEA